MGGEIVHRAQIGVETPAATPLEGDVGVLHPPFPFAGAHAREVDAKLSEGLAIDAEEVLNGRRAGLAQSGH